MEHITTAAAVQLLDEFGKPGRHGNPSSIFSLLWTMWPVAC